ncbi:PAS domain-containing sensor histidine kinase [Legionella maioricensis]|uniref:histidine kinase n=1 Tax=Legionella maioricensis TaxID=2896528 RepID=A0A9X2D3E8_9GAMM|nr:ATP-binding protein [Legionella maioricensis]MCL9685532.1 PAS domain-containing protein [Legionella maioricensis]MCL9688854.1 PAS domain-containing protein [Legionella maioricensis]
MADKDFYNFSQTDLYKQMIETTPVHMYWKNLKFEYLLCNLLQATNLGFACPAQIIGKTDYDLFPKQMADQIRKNDLEVLFKKAPCIFEEQVCDISGVNQIYLTQKIPILNKQGELCGIAGISINITARKNAEEKIRLEKEKVELTLASIIENLPGHVYWKNKDSVYQGCNLAQAKSAGFSDPKEMIGKTDYEMPWQHEADILRESDLAVINNKETLTREEASQLANSDEISIFLSKKAPLYNKNGDVIGVLGVSFDITDRKKIEQDLCQAQMAAETANQAKSEFLRNMEHQLRTPFSGIYSIVQMLAEAETEPEKKELLELTYGSAKEFLDLLNDIIDFSRYQTEYTAVLAKKFDLKKLIEKTVTMQQAAAVSKKLKLSSEYETDLPTVFIGDPYRLRRILLNLLSNAIRFTTKGRVSVQVKLGKMIDDKNLILQLIVIDTGIGISLEKQSLIYEKFYRIHPANQNKYSGAGLGLHIVKQLMADLEGEIELSSSPGKGTTFVCTIPFKRPLLDIIIDENED